MFEANANRSVNTFRFTCQHNLKCHNKILRDLPEANPKWVMQGMQTLQILLRQVAVRKMPSHQTVLSLTVPLIASVARNSFRRYQTKCFNVNSVQIIGSAFLVWEYPLSFMPSYLRDRTFHGSALNAMGRFLYGNIP